MNTCVIVVVLGAVLSQGFLASAASPPLRQQAPRVPLKQPYYPDRMTPWVQPALPQYAPMKDHVRRKIEHATPRYDWRKTPIRPGVGAGQRGSLGGYRAVKAS